MHNLPTEIPGLVPSDLDGYEQFDFAMQRLGFERLLVGTTRTVYASPDKSFVIKYPHLKFPLSTDPDPVFFNQREVKRYIEWLLKKNNQVDNIKDPQFAHCIFLYDKIIVMEFVNECKSGLWIDAKAGVKKPQWCLDIDGGQVGFTHDGRFVCFDYAG